MTAWQREAWERRVAAAGLTPGVVVTALALSLLADDEGLAVPGVARLATLSHCRVSTAFDRLAILRKAGLIANAGKVIVPLPEPVPVGKARAMNRYRLLAATVDVGQSLPGGGWS